MKPYDQEQLFQDINFAIQLTVVAIVAVVLAAWASGADVRTDRGHVERVDLIELNHYHGSCGAHAYTQIIFWDIDPATMKPHARGYRLVKAEAEEELPRKNETTGEYETVFVRSYRNGTAHRTWKVRARMYRESWSQIDPERADFRAWSEQWPLMSVQDTLR